MSQPTSTDSSATNLSVLGNKLNRFLDQLQAGQKPAVDQFCTQDEIPKSWRGIFDLLAELAETSANGTSTVPQLSKLKEPIGPGEWGECQLIREIGRGGMGVVYEAYQPALARSVALKIMPMSFANSAEQRARFQREAKAAARLHHTNIVPIFSVGEHQQVPYYCMPIVEGVNAAQWIVNRRSEQSSDLLIRQIVSMGIDLAQALSHAHLHQVLHRDIKPGNILIESNGHAWLTDFGLAKIVGELTETAEGTFLGTLRYSAPEQCRGQFDERSDVYGLGVTLYEMLTGQPAFDAVDRAQLVHQITSVEPRSLRAICATIPRDLNTVIMKAIAKDPANRYQSASLFAADLTRVLNDEPIAARPVSSLEKTWRWAKRNPLTAGLIASVLTLLTVTSIVLAISNYLVTAALAKESNALAHATSMQRKAERASDRASENLRWAEKSLNAILTGDAVVFERILPQAMHTVLVGTAEQIYRDMLARYQADPERSLEYLKANLQFAKVVRSRQQFAEAEKHMQQAKSLLNSGIPGLSDLQTRRLHAEISFERGLLAQQQEDFASAKTLFSSAFDAYQDIASNQQAVPEDYAFLLLAARKIARMHRLQNDFSTAKKVIEACHALLGNNPRELGVTDAYIDSLFELGVVLAKSKQYEEAAKILADCVTYYDGRWQQSRMVLNGADFADACHALAGVQIQLKQRDKAIENFQKSIEAMDTVVGKAPYLPKYLSQAGAILNDAGTMYLRYGDYAKARDHTRRAIVQQTKARQLDGGVYTYLDFLSRHYSNLILIDLREGKYRDAFASCDELVARKINPTAAAVGYLQVANAVAKDKNLAEGERTTLVDQGHRKTLEQLLLAVQLQRFSVEELNDGQFWNPIRNKPEFKNLVDEATTRKQITKAKKVPRS